MIANVGLQRFFNRGLLAFLKLLVNRIPDTMSFTRASSATVPDNLGVLQTVGNNVAAFEGLRLSYNLAEGATLGPEMLLDSHFADTTKWGKTDTSITVSGGKGHFVNTPTGQSLNQNVCTIGRTYRQVIDVASLTLGYLTSNNFSMPSIVAAGVTTFDGVASGVFAGINSVGITTADINSFSIKEIIPVWLPTAVEGTPLTSQGALNEPAGTNIFSNPSTPATQSITVAAVPYTLSFYGTGTITRSGVSTGSTVGIGATTLSQVTFTPTAGSLTLTLSGSITAPQLETGGYATSPALSAAATTTRAATVLSSTGIPASGPWYAEVKFRAKLNSAQIVTPVSVFGTRLDAMNFTTVVYDGSTVWFQKVVAGVFYLAAVPLTVVSGQTYALLIRLNTNGSTDVFANGVKGAGNANTLAPAVAALGAYGILNDGILPNAGGQLYGSIVSAGVKAGVVSDAQCIILTT